MDCPKCGEAMHPIIQQRLVFGSDPPRYEGGEIIFWLCDGCGQVVRPKP